ncbi:hypothetical protein BGZ57DRAFT_1007413 [Hyaloscypha finlandica]|nr:hypothetical protein BGZ57DRAFT_1007413 [Hyaloscypha finlandica]
MARITFLKFVSLVAFALPTVSASTAASFLPGTACSGQTAVVSRSSGNVDIFFSGSDGRVYTASQGPGDTHFGASNVIGNIQVAFCSSVSAISAATDKIDIFVTGADSFVYTASRTSDGSYSAWTQLAGGTASPGTPITPVSASPGNVQVFWAGTNGYVYEAELHSNNSTAIALTSDSIGAGGQITAIPRFNNPSTADVFICGGNAHVYHMLFETSDRTGKWTDISYPGSHGCGGGSPVTPIMLPNGDLHLFVTDQDNNIYTAVRTQSPAVDFSGWTKTGNLVVPTQAPVFGVVSKPNTIELYVTAQDSLIYLSTWNGGFSPWTALGNVYTMPAASISGISTGDTTFQLFATTLDKNVSTINWNVGQSLSCDWWHVGASPIACTGKASDPVVGSGNSSVSKSSANGLSIGIGFIIGMIIGVGLTAAAVFFLRRRQKAQLEKKTSLDTLPSMPPWGHATRTHHNPVEMDSKSDGQWKGDSTEHLSEVSGTPVHRR